MARHGTFDLPGLIGRRGALVRRCIAISIVALALAACSSRYDTPGEPTMYSHFAAADDIQAAVVDGDLGAVREPANWLAEHDIPSLPEGSETYLAEMQDFARQAGQATSLVDAAHAMGGIAKTCGTCHQKNIAEPLTKWTGSLHQGEDVATHMTRHAWAAGRMWEGLVLPSDDKWTKGAKALEEAPLAPEAVAGTSSEDVAIRKEVELLAKRCHAIGSKAEGVTDATERANLYGELLATCANCHKLTGREVATAG
jgi:mono/diheme cytochrome c family protein